MGSVAKWRFLLISLFMLTAFSAVAGEKVKIGYIIPDATDNWWLREWEGADISAKKHGFEVVKTEARDGEKILSTIDNYSVQGIKGFIIATPEPALGPAIVARAKKHGIKLISDANPFVGPDKKIMKDVHFSGLSAYQIGRQVGEMELNEAKKRGWNLDEVGLARMTIEELPTAMERIGGCTDYLVENGFPKANIFDAPIATWDSPGSFNAANILLTQQGKIKHWLITASNDPIVAGAVRATESRNIPAKDVIGVGINGGEEAKAEFERSQETGFYGSMFISATEHGRTVSERMYEWITADKEPPLEYLMDAIPVNRANYKEYMK